MRRIHLFLVTIFILIGCSNNKQLEGEWIEAGYTLLDDEVVFWENEIKFTSSELTREGEVYRYRISEDGDYIIVNNGAWDASVPFVLDGNELVFDEKTYYRYESKEYKERKEILEHNANEEHAEILDWQQQVEAVSNHFELSLEEANNRIISEILKRIEGEWGYEVSHSEGMSLLEDKTTVTFLEDREFQYHYLRVDNWGERIEESGGKYKISLEQDFIDVFGYKNKLDDFRIFKKSEDNETLLEDIRTITESLEKMGLDKYLTNLEEWHENNQLYNDKNYIKILVEDIQGDYISSTWYLRFLEAENDALLLGQNSSSLWVYERQ